MTLDPVTALSSTMRAHIQNVREQLRDRAEHNLLIRGEESSDRQIAWATFMFLSDFNGSTTPPTSYGIEDLYAMNLQALAVQGTAIEVLKSVSILYARNHLPFSDGGISISINDKAPQYMHLVNFLSTMYEQNKRQVKMALNVSQLLEIDSTGLFSDYSALSAGYGF